MNAAFAYLDAAQSILDRIRATQMDNIEQAAAICTHTIGNAGLVHLFGSGHSRMFVEEMFPRHGSFPGFHPIVELSLTFHNPVVGANGQRQAMFLEHIEGFAQVILRNFVFSEPDGFIVYSNSGVNEIIIDFALEVKRMGLPLIGVVSLDHCLNSKSRHSSGKRLTDLADVVIDNGTPAGDALVKIDGMEEPVGPGSTIGAAAVTNALKSLIAQKLTEAGQPPLLLTSSYFLGSEKAAQRFNEVYDQYRTSIRRVYGCAEEDE